MTLLPNIKAIRSYSEANKMPFGNALLAACIQKYCGGLANFLKIIMALNVIALFSDVLFRYMPVISASVVIYLELLYHENSSLFEEMPEEELPFCTDKNQADKSANKSAVFTAAQDWQARRGK